MAVEHNQSAWWRSALAAGMKPRPTGSDASEEQEFDVVVAGGGMAGYTAAVIAHDTGSSVVILEAGEEGGGTTWKSGGGVWAPNNALMRRRGIEDDRDNALRVMAEIAHPDRFDAEAERCGMAPADWARLEAYYDHAAEAVQALEDADAVHFALVTSMSGDFESFLPYHYDIDRGPASLYRSIAARRDDGGPGLGADLIHQASQAADRRRIELRVRHRATGVVQSDDGEVFGVTVETPDGTQTILARQGVIFATGGFPHNAELVGEHFRGPLWSSCAVETAQGDFVKIAAALGAQLRGMRNGWLYEDYLEIALQGRVSETTGISVPPGDSMIVVNSEGRRVVNEKQIYQERCEVYWHRDEDGGYPNRVLFMVYDDDVAQDNDWLQFDKFASGHPWVIEAPTLAELGERIAERLATLEEATQGMTLAADFTEQLEASIERFDAYARQGFDEEFGRGANPLEFDWHGGPRQGNDKNPTMNPLRPEGPYYCVLLCGMVLDTNGGPMVNPSSQVLDTNGTPIPGLYGAGNCVAAVAGDGYFSGGSTLGPAITFAYLAAKHAAAVPRRDLSSALARS